MSAIQTREHEEQVVVFTVGNEAYALDISRVQEIIRMQARTGHSCGEQFIEGALSLRGKVITVVE